MNVRYLLFFLFFICYFSVEAQIIWLEDFTGLPDGTVNDTGPTAWDTLGSPSGYFEVRGERMAARNTDNVMTWRSEIIDISTAGLVNISVDLIEDGDHEENQDYIRFYYVLDGGTRTPFEVNFNHFNHSEVVAYALFGSYLSGSTIQVIAEVRTTAWNEYMYFDNIAVYQAPPATLYARQNGNWTDPNTWSTTPGGAACNCVPDINTSVYIDGYNILLNSDQTINNVYMSNNANLNIESALLFVYGTQFTIDASSSMREQVAEAKVIFSGDFNNATFTNNSAAGVLLDELDMMKDAKLIIEGSGDIYLNNDIDVDKCDSLVFNNTSTITITDDLGVSTSNVTIINNSANLVILDDLKQGSWHNNIHVENYGTITCDDINFGNNRFRIHNYGTITNNDILNVGSNNEIHNHDNASWTYRGELKDPDINLFASYTDNTFIYDRAGNQEIIEPQSSYYYLEITGSGIKSTDFAALIVDRDLTIRDAAVLDPGSFGTNITVRDDFASFSSQVDPFIPGTTTVTIGSNLTNRIESTQGIRFYNLVVNSTSIFRLKQKDLFIENNLQIVNGELNTENDGRFVILDNATITGYDASRFINGPIQKIGDEPFLFPLGDNGNYRPLQITAPANVADAFTAYYRNEAIPASYDINQKDYALDNIINCSYYIFTRDVGASSVQVTYPWQNECPVPNFKHLTIAGWNGSHWVDEGQEATSGTTTSGTITNEGTLANYQVLALALRTLQPSLVNDSYNLNEDGTLSDNVMVNDGDPMSFNLSVSTTLVQEPVNGIFSVGATGAFTYTPNADFFGTDSVQYQTCNDAPNSKCDTAFAYFTVATVNDLPVALNDTLQIDEDNMLTANVLANDTELEAQPLTASVTQVPINGNVILAGDGSFTYTPNADFNGKDIFEYQACDDQTPAGCSVAKVIIDILPVNDPPVAVDDNFTLPQYAELTENVMANDYDIDSQLLQTAIVSNPNHGNITFNINGDFNYVPDADFSGTDQFTYSITDDDNTGDTATVVLAIIPNAAPVALDQTHEIYSIAVQDICLNASDADGDFIRISAVVIDHEFGIISNVDSAGICFQHSPAFKENEQYSIEVVVCDPWQCDTAQVNVNSYPDITQVYQALSPNNDGFNDTWIIDGIENYPNNEVKIFNRYGDLVFVTKGYDNQKNIWTGKSNQALVLNKNAVLPAGTYFYSIQLSNGSKPKTGYVVLDN